MGLGFVKETAAEKSPFGVWERYAQVLLESNELTFYN